MNRFYAATTEILIKSDALIDKLVGDQVVALYLPLFSGHRHARRAIEAARGLLDAIASDDPERSRLPIGIGVHTGTAYVGTVGGSQGTFSDLTALGDPVNVAARLASLAAPGEALISDSAWEAAGLGIEDHQRRMLQLKGRAQPVSVRVITAADLARSVPPG